MGKKPRMDTNKHELVTPRNTLKTQKWVLVDWLVMFGRLSLKLGR